MDGSRARDPGARGDGEAFASLAVAAATGCTRSRTGSCAMWIWPRTRPSRRCSRSGRTFPCSATRPALRPGRTAFSSTPATTRDAGGVFGTRTCTSCATTTRRRETSDQVHDRDQLERGFRRLSIDHRAVVVLHTYLGLSLEEIADTLGASPGTIRSRLHYAVRAMRAALDADERPALREVAP